MVRATYILGWVFLIIAVVERLLLLSESVLRMAVEHNVLPRNFLELSLLLFVISIASAQCRAASGKAS